MALACKICEKPVDALTSVRCRQCHQLVCRRCIADADAGEGSAVCEACAAAQAEQAAAREAEAVTAAEEVAPPEGEEAPAAAGPPPTDWRAALRAQWKAVAFVVLLATLFLGIVFYPALRAKVLRSRLASDAPGVAAAAQEELVARGGNAVRREMMAELLHGTGESRRRAAEVLGMLGHTPALPMLRAIAEDPKEPPLLRETAREAVVRIEEY